MTTAVRVWGDANSTADAGAANLAAEVVRLLRAGQPVALPTETVYGLAADALNPAAAARIFETKERPKFDPLIVHLPNRDWLEQVAQVPPEQRELVEQLISKFWPGPFTMVLPKQAIVPDIVTAGLATVAVRMSAHPVFSAIIKDFGQPLAAPSANRFGRISPTSAQHVLEELNGRISLIVDGGATAIGVESTIVRLDRGTIQMLRSGPVAEEELSEFAPVNIAAPSDKIQAPGQLPAHYAPRTPLRVVNEAWKFNPNQARQVGLLAWNEPPTQHSYVAIRRLSEKQDLREAATNLFRLLRELDAMNLDLIVAETVPHEGLGVAINDRLGRAAAAN